ncbi:MAG: hypothetical protein IT376_20610 [Polyangiaceae bacterium]|nr:hypothetical protein [Polyangiaceae bacterium]
MAPEPQATLSAGGRPHQGRWPTADEEGWLVQEPRVQQGQTLPAVVAALYTLAHPARLQLEPPRRATRDASVAPSADVVPRGLKPPAPGAAAGGRARSRRGACPRASWARGRP